MQTLETSPSAPAPRSRRPEPPPIPASPADEAAWRGFIGHYHEALAAGARRGFRRGGVRARREQVEEAVQEAYCRLLDGEGHRLEVLRGRPSRVVTAYLRRLASHLVLDRLRAAAALKRGGPGRPRPKAHPRAVAPEIVEEQRGWVLVSRSDLRREELVCRRESPEEILLRRERRSRFLRRCRELAAAQPGQRDIHIFLLATLGGWSSKRIARRAYPGLSPSGVDSVVFRVRRRLEAAGLSLPRRPPR